MRYTFVSSREIVKGINLKSIRRTYTYAVRWFVLNKNNTEIHKLFFLFSTVTFTVICHTVLCITVILKYPKYLNG